MLLTSIGTVSGALFSNYVLFPGMMKFFAAFSSAQVRMMPSINDTFDHYIYMMIGMVAVFQMPTLMFFLAKLRLVTARFLWTHFLHAILIIFIVAALLTPSTDWWNQTMFALPMIVLYLISIVIAWIVGPKGDADSQVLWRTTKLGLAIAAAHLQWADGHRRRRRPYLAYPKR